MQSDPPLDAAPLSACRSVCRSVCKRGCGCRPREWVKGRGGGRGRHTLGGVVTTDGPRTGAAARRSPAGRMAGRRPRRHPCRVLPRHPWRPAAGSPRRRGSAPRRRRLVACSRPGYGGSTDARSTLASVAADAGCLADQLALTRFARSASPVAARSPSPQPPTSPTGSPPWGSSPASGRCSSSIPTLRAQPAVRASLAGAHEEALAFRMPRSLVPP